ncbi:hypothetical protein WR25_13581 [Diploscapter pachys]|uniref:Uncharacterized protein n=1 Tax=Diploscapter pachys TaxID=2018661 RepID=A0A2A2K2V6_9BILA|nr:hypothetical protein WR25_13581 [Diploscapter pachys]
MARRAPPHPSAGDRMRAEKADRHQRDADDDQPQRCRRRDGDARDQHDDRQPEHPSPPDPSRKAAEQRRTHRSQDIEQEDHADRRLAEAIRRRDQAEARVIVQRDEQAHQQEGFGVEQRQRPVAQQDRDAGERVARGARDEAARRRCQPAKRLRHHHAGEADAAQRPAPIRDVRDQAGDQSPAHAAQRAAGDVQPHRRAHRRRIHLFGDIGHGDRRHAGKRKAGEQPKCQQGMPSRCHRCGKRQQPRRKHRRDHQWPPPDPVGQDAREQDGDRQRAGRERHGQGRALRAQRIIACEQRQQRLDGVEQRKGRKAREQHRQRQPAIGGRAERNGRDGRVSGRHAPGVPRSPAPPRPRGPKRSNRRAHRSSPHPSAQDRRRRGHR